MRTLALILAVLSSRSLAQNLGDLNDKYGRESRITNGADAEEGQFPYQAILRENGRFLCGGSIIDEKWILTAAHCLTSTNPDDWTVTVGTISLTSGTDHAVSKIIPHDKFNMKQDTKYDIALFSLKKKIKFSDKVKKVTLEWRPVGEVDCVVSGFGSTRYIFQEPSQKLKYLKTTVTRGWKCMLMGGDLSKLCTEGPMFSSACAGDSGGPLVANGKQIGIVSYGGRFCTGVLPTVYTRVSYYLPWIKKTMLNTKPGYRDSE